VRRALLVLACAGLLAATTAPRFALAADPAALADACRALQRGVDRADAGDIQRARAAFVALQADEPGAAVLAYWVALCCWRAEPLVLPNDRDAARRLCKDGIAACDRAFALDPRFGEALALKAGLQGLAITFVPDAMMSLGAEMQEEFARASTLEPKNPRIAFLAALITLHKPADVGGGPKAARAAFDRALALYDAGDAPGKRGIKWGHDDALLWSGIALSRLGDWEGARERFRRALAVNPDQGWVRTRLLPEAERHLAAPADSSR
jgi:tetratricopeptide (TPR) repeat protein